MSLVSGYPQGLHPGAIPHQDATFAYGSQSRYQDGPPQEGTYFGNWVLNTPGELSSFPQDPYCLQTSEYTNFAQMHGFPYFNGETKVRVVKRRVSANKKERRRTLSINGAFADLRGCIPNVPSDTKLSKIKTLRLATSYIAYLMDILAKDDPTLTEDGFKAEINKKIESKEERRKRELAELNNALAQSGEKRSKGRTGWPQHVWAQELKQ